jgi:hypothetical protein
MNVLRRVGGGGGGGSSSNNANSSQVNAGSDANASSSGANGLAGSGTGGIGHAGHSDGLGGGGADGSSSPPDKHFGLENVSAPRLHWTILVLPGGELPLIRFVLSCPVLSCLAHNPRSAANDAFVQCPAPPRWTCPTYCCWLAQFGNTW